MFLLCIWIIITISIGSLEINLKLYHAFFTDLRTKNFPFHVFEIIESSIVVGIVTKLLQQSRREPGGMD